MKLASRRHFSAHFVPEKQKHGEIHLLQTHRPGPGPKPATLCTHGCSSRAAPALGSLHGKEHSFQDSRILLPEPAIPMELRGFPWEII